MFDSHDDLEAELIRSHTWSALHAALHASRSLAVQALEEPDGIGLRFSQPRPRTTALNGRITVDPATGSMTVFAQEYSGRAWFTVLERLGAITPGTGAGDQPVWSWQPYDRERPVSLSGTVQLGPRIRAEAVIERAKGTNTTTAAAGVGLTLPPGRYAPRPGPSPLPPSAP